jgi:hypothetical protein
MAHGRVNACFFLNKQLHCCVVKNIIAFVQKETENNLHTVRNIGRIEVYVDSVCHRLLHLFFLKT